MRRSLRLFNFAALCLALNLLLSACSMFGGGSKRKADTIARDAQLVDKGMNSFDLSALSEVASEKLTTFKNGRLIKGRTNLLSNDAVELNDLQANGIAIKCCKYIDGPHSKSSGDLAYVWYLASLEMSSMDGTTQLYQGHVTRIFEVQEKGWKMTHSHQDWAPTGDPYQGAVRQNASISGTLPTQAPQP